MGPLGCQYFPSLLQDQFNSLEFEQSSVWGIVDLYQGIVPCCVISLLFDGGLFEGGFLDEEDLQGLGAIRGFT